jgi:hypothetical protein
LDLLAAGAGGGVFAAHERAARQSFRPPRCDNAHRHILLAATDY